MGYHCHHAIVVICSYSRADQIRLALEGIRLAECPEMPSVQQSPAGVNGFVTITVPADGSKEDWPDSDLGDAARAEMKSWLQENTWGPWAEVALNEEHMRAVTDSDEHRPEREE